MKITCKEAVDFVSKQEEAELSWVKRLQLWRHLSECSLCRIFSRQSSIIKKAYQLQRDDASSLSPQEKQQIINAVLNDGGISES